MVKLYKQYVDEKELIETTLEDERQYLEEYYVDVDMLANTELYPIVENTDERFSFRTHWAYYYWIDKGA